MEAPKTLRRPSNWQDFETLCKKLWGEIWNCAEIQKNGRLGQEQSGVDIFGIPLNENEYFGIQCKGKSEYNDNHPQFTEKEIDAEIEKAKLFIPKLKKLYFATTALNDSKIQSYIRLKNIENRNANLFEIHLFCWETIVDLIDENKQTNDWYTKNQRYKSNKNAIVTFNNDLAELSTNVVFQKVITEYKQKIMPAVSNFNSLFESFKFNNHSIYDYKINNSYYRFYFKIHNIGEEPIEDFKIILKFDGSYQDLDVISKGGGMFMPVVNYSYDTYINKEDKTGKIIPSKKILVGEDVMSFDDMKIKPFPVNTEITIDWKIISKDYKNNGKLKLLLTPEIKYIQNTILVDDPFDVRIEEGEIEDYITENERKKK